MLIQGLDKGRCAQEQSLIFSTVGQVAFTLKTKFSQKDVGI